MNSSTLFRHRSRKKANDTKQFRDEYNSSYLKHRIFLKYKVLMFIPEIFEGCFAFLCSLTSLVTYFEKGKRVKKKINLKGHTFVQQL